jgi:hypothetical protein
MGGREVKERPILFSAPMVKAILAGTKTQTRRVVTKRNSVLGSGTWPEDGLARAFPQRDGSKLMLPGEDDTSHRLWPKWEPGDRLWVKETHCYFNEANELVVAYRADEWTECPADNDKWKPSIFCTRAASRITLEITKVRVERLQDITDADALAEAVGPTDPKWVGTVYTGKWKSVFNQLWQSINGPDSWAANPWVWVIEFRRVQP